MLRSSLPISSQSPGVSSVGIRRTSGAVRLVTLGTAVVAALSVAGCGVAEPVPDAAVKPVTLEVSPAKFSKTAQVTGDEVTFSMTIKNVGQNPAPGILVKLKGNDKTVLADPNDEGRLRTEKDDLPNAVTRAAWFVDLAPSRTPLSQSTMYPGGPLEPGEARTMRWRLNAQTVGEHELGYQVFAGQTAAAAEATGGTGLTGGVKAVITNK